MTSRELTRQVFISNAKSDRDLAAELAQVLSTKGLRVWTDREIAPDADWSKAVERALADSDSMIVLLSQNSYRSAYVRSELDYALSDSRYRHRLLPVLIDVPEEDASDCIPWIVCRMRHLSLSQRESGLPAATKIAEAFIALLKGEEEA